MNKKFIGPGGWFSIEYPSKWSEFEDEEGTFLFYNPGVWSGNFRISAFKDSATGFAKQMMKEELDSNSSAVVKRIGDWDCVYSCERFTENGIAYESHFYVTGKETVSIECSFTANKGQALDEAEAILKSLVVRTEHASQGKEVIPIRVWEIHQINEAYDWVTMAVKKILKKDFTGSLADLDNLQTLIDSDLYKPGQRETWEAFGIAFGSILTNEMDGMVWKTVIDEPHEYPILQFTGTSVVVEPLLLITQKKRKGEPCNLKQLFNQIKQEIEAQL